MTAHFCFSRAPVRTTCEFLPRGISALHLFKSDGDIRAPVTLELLTPCKAGPTRHGKLSHPLLMAERLNADAPHIVAPPTILPDFQNKLVFGISPATSHGFSDGSRKGGAQEAYGPILGAHTVPHCSKTSSVAIKRKINPSGILADYTYNMLS